MKTYKTTIWKERDGALKRNLCFLTISLLFAVIIPAYSFEILGIGILCFLFYFFVGANLYHYVQCDQDNLIVCHLFYPFSKAKHPYESIRTAAFNSVYNLHFSFFELRIYTCENRSRRYAINLVSDEDVLRLIEELKSHGVRVTTTQEFDDYYAAIEQRQREKAQGEALRRKAREYEEACRREREKLK